MWVKLSSLIIKNRLILVIITGLITIFMAFNARKVEMTYDFVKVVPSHDPDLIYFNEFREQYGEDGNILAIGMQDSTLFTPEKFRAFQKMNKDLAALQGIKEVVSLPEMKMLVKDTVAKNFVTGPVFDQPVQDQEDLDKKLKAATDVKFYQGLLYNENTKATLVAVSIEKEILNSPDRQQLVDNLMEITSAFSAENNIELHYAGLPYVRSVMVGKVQAEFKLFLALAALVTSVILFFFFRSFFVVLFTFLVILIMVTWTMGTLVLFGYKVTLLTGILPAVIIVISIPNCIYMFNKYHQEYRRHGNKIKGISRIIQKIGFLTLMTNTTTAIGFLVLYTTDISIIKEFGLLAGIITFSTFLITIVVIPSLLLFLPAPNAKQLKHLDLKFLRKINFFLEHSVLRYRPVIYIVTVILVSIAIVGVYKIQAVSYMVDDLPEKSNVKTDLAFFEQHFEGVMPLEIVIDLGKPKAVTKQANLEKLEEFEEFLTGLENVSPPISILNIIKGSTQAFYNGDPDQYRLPSTRERPFIQRYAGKGAETNDLIKSFVGADGRQVRFSAKVADLGTIRMNELVKNVIEPKAKEIFNGEEFQVRITGTTLLFLKGNEYLINGLTTSLIIAFFLISLMMALLFSNVRMVLISLIPNMVPLVVTIGIMGLFGIPLKPSTALIFSIAFGIAVDDTIHYLSKYRQELIIYKGNVLQSVTRALEEAGVSMIYTSIVLFCGFVIFAWSDFGGTVALGILTSITLVFAMLTNLTLLPSLLLTFSRGSNRNLFPIVKTGEKFHCEEDDEELDLNKLVKGHLEIKPEQASEIQRI